MRFHRARDRDRKRLITITASCPDAAINEEAFSASAASEKPASGQEEGRNDAEHDDQASASEPTRSGPLAPTADAAETAESVQPGPTPSKVTPQVADSADAGIRNKSVEFVRHIPGTRIPVLRHRTFSAVRP